MTIHNDKIGFMVNINKRPEKGCPTCGDHFVCVRPEQKYCSRKCIPAPGRKHNVCPCGVNTGSYQKKYCCDEHREQWGSKKAPARMVTHTCLGCGEDFERPHYYPGKKKYCSNKCAHREVKSVRDKFILDLNDKAIVFHSMWEVRFVAACERFDIPWRRYDGPDIQTPVGVYRPDFIVNDDTVVEVKGWLRSGNAEKISNTTVLVIDKEALLAFEQDGIVILRKA